MIDLRKKSLLPFLVLLFTRCISAQTSSSDPITLINQVAMHYSNTKSLHLEATEHRITHTDLSDYSTTSILSAYVAPGNRFRYDGKNGQGSSLIVSDGISEWRMRRSFGQYTKFPAGTYFRGPQVYTGDDESIIDAHGLLRNIVSMRGTIDLARFLPAESLNVNGHTIRCIVIEFEYAMRVERDPSEPVVYHHTIWIDPTSLTIIKLQTRGHYRQMQGMLSAPLAHFTDTLDETIFSVTDLSFVPSQDIFVFTSSQEATEIASFPNPFPTPGNDPVADQYVGKPLPSIVLHDASGAEVNLSRYRGHPLLIDIWATWCGPCMNDLPSMGKIRTSTASTDLQMIGIDEDDKTADAVNLLKKRDYDWQDFHLNQVTEKQLSVIGIPLVLLVDSTGTIVYYHSGEGNTKALAGAIAKLGKEYEVVRTE